MAKNGESISWFHFSNEFMGREIFNKRTGVVYMKWEAYHKIKRIWFDVRYGKHIEFGYRDKPGFCNGKYLRKRRNR